MPAVRMLAIFIRANPSVPKIGIVVVERAAHTSFEVWWFTVHVANLIIMTLQSRRKATPFDVAFLSEIR